MKSDQTSRWSYALIFKRRVEINHIRFPCDKYFNRLYLETDRIVALVFIETPVPARSTITLRINKSRYWNILLILFILTFHGPCSSTRRIVVASHMQTHTAHRGQCYMDYNCYTLHAFIPNCILRLVYKS